MTIINKWVLSVLTASILLVSCGKTNVSTSDESNNINTNAQVEQNNRQSVLLTGFTMGTSYHITFFPSEIKEKDNDKVKQEIEDILKEINRQMSTYQIDSEISQFNQSKELNKPFKISKDFAYVVKESIRLHKLTEGFEDITVGPLVNLWGFGPKKQTQIPTQEEVNEVKKNVGIQYIELTYDEANKNYSLSKKENPNVNIDLSSIAKGFGVDKISAYLADNGATNYLVEIGGELYTHGKNQNGHLWNIAIEKPEYIAEREVGNIIQLDNLGIATSGDYRNFVIKNGIRYSHEIDPNTGYPINHNLASVSVLNESVMTADGLATGLYVAGPEKALEIAKANNIAILIIVKEGDTFKQITSPAFDEYIKKYKSE